MQAQAIPFRKMNGLGNDFVVLDARSRALPLGADALRAIADRKEGIGCDQIIALEPSRMADVFMRIWNADGGEVGACGNAARCVAGIVAAERGEKTRQHRNRERRAFGARRYRRHGNRRYGRAPLRLE